MSDTPETDHLENELGSAAKFSHPVMWRHARQLEIERDEAREELYDIRLNLGEDAEGYTLIHAVCVLQQERDEAREEAQKSKAYKRVLKVTNENLKRERDEAREHAQRFRSLHYSHLEINGSASWFPWEEKLGHE